MKVYMSLWTQPKNSMNQKFLALWKLSIALVKKHYGSVELITDSTGYKFLKDLPFDNYHIVLDKIPKYPNVWSLGKIYAYKYACQNSDHFLHLDNDVFLWESLPNSLVNSKIFCQSEDLKIGENFYSLEKLKLYMPNIKIPKIWYNNIGLTAYNVGIFGGYEIKTILDYCNFCIDMVDSEEFHSLFAYENISKNHLFNINTSRSVLIEQANLAICLKNKFNPHLLFSDLNDVNKTTYKKYTHLMTAKQNDSILQAISQRVSQEPYNLIPSNVSKENW